MNTRKFLLLLLGGFLLLDVFVLGGYWMLSRRPVVKPTASAPASRATNQEVPLLLAEAFVLKGKGQQAEALKIFQEIVRIDPKHSDAFHGLAQVQRDLGNPAEALFSHDRAIELDPKRHALYWERGVTHQRLKDYDAAIRDFEACLERNSQFANAHLGLGECYRAKGDLEKSLNELNQAIALKPDSDWFHRERGNTYRQMGQQEKAEADFAKMRELQQGRQ